MKYRRDGRIVSPSCKKLIGKGRKHNMLILSVLLISQHANVNLDSKFNETSRDSCLTQHFPRFLRRDRDENIYLTKILLKRKLSNALCYKIYELNRLAQCLRLHVVNIKHLITIRRKIRRKIS